MSPFFLGFSSECPTQYIAGITIFPQKMYSSAESWNIARKDVHSFLRTSVKNIPERAIWNEI